MKSQRTIYKIAITSITGVLLATVFTFAGSLRADAEPAKTMEQGASISCGIAEIDRIRAEVALKPTNASNIQSRRAALYRCWRLLWHQGYDMNMKGYDATWDRLLSRRDAAALKAVDAAYAAMEEGVPALYGNKVFSHHRNGYFYSIE